MSKYIRTESEIIYVGDLIKDEYGNYCDPKNYETDMEVSKEYILKEADTIEELCDEFVCYGNNTYSLLDRITTIDKYAVFKDKSADRVSNLIKAGCVFYGAIWTSKGLIYVAKMNEKGELELL